MSGGGEDETDKSYEATPQKLMEARRKGDIAKSTDLITAAAYAGLLVAFMAAGETTLRQVGTTLMVLLDRSAELAPLVFEGAPMPVMGTLLRDTAVGLSPVFLLPAAAALLAVLAQRALVFAPSKLTPKMSRISLISNAKNKFGRNGLFEFAKSFVKLTIYSICLALFLRARLPEMLSAMRSGPRPALSLMAELCLAFLMVVVLISAAIGAVDALWQHFEHLRKNRMSRKEITDETRNDEGDPHLKQERRQRAMAIAQNQMLADVPGADVVIVNPTHYAVALKWSRAPGSAPTCVAKGMDEIARIIRERAEEAGVPIHRDPPTARALHATTELGDEIHPDHFRAVAAAIRFAEAMRQKARGRT
jgi:flagellar biosynthesis protein FlhB